MMKILNHHIELGIFYDQLRRAPQKALLLDYDGTLAPFHVNPERASPYSGVPEMLDKIMQVPNVRLVIITGRWIKDLMPLLQLERQPEIWGSHGIERLKVDGSYEISTMDEDLLAGLVKADEWIEHVGLAERSEQKPGCLAIHWRGLNEDQIEAIRNLVEPEWTAVSKSTGLGLKEFDGGLELRVPARDKGDAVRTILEEMPTDTVAAYLGDDNTDEDAFQTIKGHGLGVLVRKDLRPTAADLWIRPPEELLQFFEAWLTAPERASV
jgi:trehalose 6-phosphate phosphatase